MSTTTVTVCSTVRGLSSSRRPVAPRVAAIWLLAVSLINAHDHQTAPGQMSNMTIPTVASKASTSEGEARPGLTSFCEIEVFHTWDRSPISPQLMIWILFGRIEVFDL